MQQHMFQWHVETPQPSVCVVGCKCTFVKSPSPATKELTRVGLCSVQTGKLPGWRQKMRADGEKRAAYANTEKWSISPFRKEGVEPTMPLVGKRSAFVSMRGETTIGAIRTSSAYSNFIARANQTNDVVSVPVGLYTLTDVNSVACSVDQSTKCKDEGEEEVWHNGSGTMETSTSPTHRDNVRYSPCPFCFCVLLYDGTVGLRPLQVWCR